jgi:hypothetical protein
VLVEPIHDFHVVHHVQMHHLALYHALALALALDLDYL